MNERTFGGLALEVQHEPAMDRVLDLDARAVGVIARGRSAGALVLQGLAEADVELRIDVAAGDQRGALQRVEAHLEHVEADRLLGRLLGEPGDLRQSRSPSPARTRCWSCWGSAWSAAERPVAMKSTISTSDIGGSDDSVRFIFSIVPWTSSLMIVSSLLDSELSGGLYWAWMSTRGDPSSHR